MHEAEKFRYYPMRKPGRIQPDCPVYLYSYGLAVQHNSGAAFVQLRLVNRSESRVQSVFLHMTGRNMADETLYELRYVPLVDCGGEPHKDFGEEQVLFLPEGQVQTLDVEIEDILFEDGMIWRGQTGQRLLTAEEAGWVTCSCGMKNPGEAQHCCYCRRGLRTDPAEPLSQPKAIVFPGMEPAVKAQGSEPVAEEEPRYEAEELTAVPVSEEPLVTEPPVAEDPIKDAVGDSAEEVTPGEPVPEELAALLAQLGSWSSRPGQEQIPEAPQDEDGAEDGSDGAEQREEPPEQESSGPSADMMQETSQLIRELRRRIQARENGEEIIEESTPDTDTVGAAEESKDPKDRSRGFGFWIFMILLMICLALAGFFGILYLKGYFG